MQESVAGRQLDVDAGLESQGGGLTAVGGDGVHDFEECHGEIVGDDNAVEAEFLPQHPGEVIGIRGHRHAVDVSVGIHHRPRAPVEDRHLERWEKDVRDLPRPRADGRRRTDLEAADQARRGQRRLAAARRPALTGA